eukprot:3892195-Rhodomonas_salina.1
MPDAAVCRRVKGEGAGPLHASTASLSVCCGASTRADEGRRWEQDRIGKRRFDPNKWKRSREKVSAPQRGRVQRREPLCSRAFFPHSKPSAYLSVAGYLQVEVERRKMSKRAAIVAVVGIILPIIQNELIYQVRAPPSSCAYPGSARFADAGHGAARK